MKKENLYIVIGALLLAIMICFHVNKNTQESLYQHVQQQHVQHPVQGFLGSITGADWGK